MVDAATKKALSGIPLLRTKAGPRDKEVWAGRLKEEYMSLIKYITTNKEADNDWFRLESNKEGTRWFGKCTSPHLLPPPPTLPHLLPPHATSPPPISRQLISPYPTSPQIK